MIPIEEELLLKLVEASVNNRRKDLDLILKIISYQVEPSSPNLAKAISKYTESRALRSRTLLNPHPEELPELPKMLIDASNDILEPEPVLQEKVAQEVNEILNEQNNFGKLIRNNLNPINTILFEGPPGVGKTLTAKWIAKSLHIPIYILDLASVMNSHLGKTGNNIKEIFNFSSTKRCVLLLDEFDAIAKKRGDESEIGELKRLVTVILQALDNMSSESIVIAATNHPELLDRAVWRRFERKLIFTLPNEELIINYINSISNEPNLSALAHLFKGQNFSDIYYTIKRAKKLAFLNNNNLISELLELLLKDKDIENMDIEEKKLLAISMIHSGFSQRDASKKLLLSRPTIKKELDKLEGFKK